MRFAFILSIDQGRRQRVEPDARALCEARQRQQKGEQDQQSFPGVHDAARICLPCLATAGMPWSAGQCSQCLVPADGRPSEVLSLTRALRLSPGRGAADPLQPCALGDFTVSPTPVSPDLPWRINLETTSTLPLAGTWPVYTRLVMNVMSNLPQLTRLRNARSGGETFCSFIDNSSLPFSSCALLRPHKPPSPQLADQRREERRFEHAPEDKPGVHHGWHQ